MILHLYTFHFENDLIKKFFVTRVSIFLLIQYISLFIIKKIKNKNLFQ